MVKATGDLTACLCGCGELTSGQWRRGHHGRGEGGYDPAKHGAPGTPLPPPPDSDGDPADDDDGLTVIDPPELAAVPDDYRPRHGATLDDDDPAGQLPPDPPPVAPRDIPVPRGKHVKVTAAMRRDIAAKVGLGLSIPGHVWAARDPLCGGTFVQQIPATTDAFTDLICDSPDLVAAFTGPGSAFMKYLKLIMALQPVGQVMFAHHIAHTVSIDEGQGQGQAAGQVPAGAYAA